MVSNLEQLKYPIGQFSPPQNIGYNDIKNWIETIKLFPERLKNEVANLSPDALEKTYRPEGWTITQIVHHCADSHMNSFIRFKLALTEDTPTIKPYFENLWAQLPEAKHYPIESSIAILEGLHDRWAFLLHNLSNDQLDKHYLHPENNQLLSLKETIGKYAWHCQHHLAHIKLAKQS
ncbi:MAG: YfiT family bacillithiol transferase [Flavobacteriaceae bacterium]